MERKEENQIELLDEERSCLEAMREDFNRGIVLICEGADERFYTAQLKKDRQAGQSWLNIERKLLANRAAILKKSVDMSKLTGNESGKGAILVGVFEDGALGIRQRSQAIVNVIWSNDWGNGDTNKGELMLFFHTDLLIERPVGRLAKTIEINEAVRQAGYYLPANTQDYVKRGPVAAYEAVTGMHYVMSPNGKEWRAATLDVPEDTDDDTDIPCIYFSATHQLTQIAFDEAFRDEATRGAILWIKR